MEGVLLVPPDRGTILGRAVWKPRYVVIGPVPQKDGGQSTSSLSQVLSAARIKDGGASSKQPQKISTDTIYLSVFKSKEDLEPIYQHSTQSITECQVQQLAYRKQGHVLPTLTVQISPEPTSDKLRKRRSSRTGGLTSSKDPGPLTLCFRPAEASRYGLGDWARYIHSLIQPEVPGGQPMSPISPLSTSFMNPFAPIPDATNEPPSATTGTKGKLRSKLQPRSSGRGQPSTRDPGSAYTSEAPSLRSRRSDVSSHTSSMVPAAMTFVQQHYTTLQHSALPSPASTIGDNQELQLIEGWTSAQGRSSALSSPIRGRGSISSSQGQNKTNTDSSSPQMPHKPRETILDRAFQMRCIPGSDRPVLGEEKLTSLAKFEALMREAEDRRRPVDKARLDAVREPAKNTLEDEDEDETDDEDENFGKEVDDDDSDDDAFDQGETYDEMNSSTVKALQFIVNRHSAMSGSRGSHYSDSGVGGLGTRPHTAHSRMRPATQRTISQPNPPFHLPSSPLSRPVEEMSHRRHEKRHSTSDVKNMNFNEFAKRLSGTSSLLILQTNTSTGSSRGSGDFDSPNTPRGSLSPLTPSEREERCRWRGSLGVVGGNEGGFL
ncbi:hypothetical protein F5Y18DRAFT_407363 [Xylariaceae sp. FL1019]|nr:hypothetical protein F5Y18DRAFT_407363 [Xylariaceae sp. FL1019]